MTSQQSRTIPAGVARCAGGLNNNSKIRRSQRISKGTGMTSGKTRCKAARPGPTPRQAHEAMTAQQETPRRAEKEISARSRRNRYSKEAEKGTRRSSRLRGTRRHKKRHKSATGSRKNKQVAKNTRQKRERTSAVLVHSPYRTILHVFPFYGKEPMSFLCQRVLQLLRTKLDQYRCFPL